MQTINPSEAYWTSHNAHDHSSTGPSQNVSQEHATPSIAAGEAYAYYFSTLVQWPDGLPALHVYRCLTSSFFFLIWNSFVGVYNVSDRIIIKYIGSRPQCEVYNGSFYPGPNICISLYRLPNAMSFIERIYLDVTGRVNETAVLMWLPGGHIGVFDQTVDRPTTDRSFEPPFYEIAAASERSEPQPVSPAFLPVLHGV
ncbi:hypothetical protein FA95DRAFT_1613614 [Auriscalpium vulgare]|uniref:Uncharacterized protein n=1 Tax=Auriscalpium vulgare TaxID=40419 RepID=A0ACB8R280_9AGAM|nr:hypothetical protein FA95DRAFT_1613614 [Auriscalpium vulgare]